MHRHGRVRPLVVKLLAFVLSLGIDTLVVSVSLGASQRSGLVRTAVAFATAEALMPLVGLLIGRAAGGVIGPWASLAGGLALVALGAWMIFLGDDDDGDGGGSGARAAGAGRRERSAGPLGLALVLAAVSVSLDELAAGFSMGMVGVPAALTITLVALQSFVFTLLGLRFGARLRPYLGEWAERAAGAGLGLLGAWIAVDAVATLPLLHAAVGLRP